MKKEGYSETTVELYVRLLKVLAEHADLLNPESVKEALTRADWSEATKEMACGAYTVFPKQHRFTFVPPHIDEPTSSPSFHLNLRSSSS
jgi:hypothetical protein